jgi:Rv2632c-like
MRAMRQWRADIMIGEDEGRTYAEARLITGSPNDLVGVGRAQVSPDDPDVPEIGDEVAVARALRSLADHLLATASSDIGEVTRAEVHLTR